MHSLAEKKDLTVNILKVGEETESVPGSFRIFGGEPLERKVSLRDALTQILQRYEDLSFMLDGDEILISTREQIEAKEQAGQQQAGAECLEFLKPYPKLHGSRQSRLTSLF